MTQIEHRFLKVVSRFIGIHHKPDDYHFVLMTIYLYLPVFIYTEKKERQGHKIINGSVWFQRRTKVVLNTLQLVQS